MRAFFQFAILIGLCASGIGQTPDPAIRTSLCALYEKPELYEGKIVRVHASLNGIAMSLDDFDDRAVCSSYMRVLLVADSGSAQSQLVAAFASPRGTRFRSATFEGRFEAAFNWKDHKRINVNPDVKIGFGKKHDFDARIIFSQISDIETAPILRK